MVSRSFVVFVVFVVSVAAAPAAVIVVETNQDGVTGPLCDIRDAIGAANDDVPRGGCDVGGDGADVIDLTGLDEPLELTNGVLATIRGDVTFRGPGTRDFAIDGLALTKMFVIGSGNVVIEDLTIANGLAAEAGRGGCIQVEEDGVLTLDDVRVTGCVAPEGGAIAIDGGSLRIVDSLLDGNSTTDGSGAGILNTNGTLSITNSTLSNNVANGEDGTGGGVASIPPIGDEGGTTQIYSSTIADNGASSGGNLFTGAGMTTTLTHTLVAQPKSGGNCAGSVASTGYNLATDTSCVLTGTADRNETLAGIDVLADNGGPTDTHAVLAGSAAIDGGSPIGCRDEFGNLIPFDQRGPGFPRRTNGNLVGATECDIGAFETVPEPLAGALGLAAIAALAVVRAGSRIG